MNVQVLPTLVAETLGNIFVDMVDCYTMSKYMLPRTRTPQTGCLAHTCEGLLHSMRKCVARDVSVALLPIIHPIDLMVLWIRVSSTHI